MATLQDIKDRFDEVNIYSLKVGDIVVHESHPNPLIYIMRHDLDSCQGWMDFMDIVTRELVQDDELVSGKTYLLKDAKLRVLIKFPWINNV